MKNTLLLIIIAVAFSFASCKRDPQIGVQMVYTENQCANPFEIAKNPSATMQNLKNYLMTNRIEVLGSQYEKYKNQVVCLACNCPKGKGYYHYVLINDDDQSKAEELGLKVK